MDGKIVTMRVVSVASDEARPTAFGAGAHTRRGRHPSRSPAAPTRWCSRGGPRLAHVSLRDVYSNWLPATSSSSRPSGSGWTPTCIDHWPSPRVDASLFDALIRQFRHIFEPWEQNPRILESFVLPRSAPSGDRLLRQGVEAAEPISALQGLEPAVRGGRGR